MAKKKTKVLVSFLLDETGSMLSRRDSTIRAFNEYIESLRGDKNASYRFTLTKFNSTKTETIHDAIKLKDLPELTMETYQPAMNTPLYDAMGRTIRTMERTAKKLEDTAVLVAVMTDGEENDSREWGRQQVFDLIKEKEKKGWQFAFLGADQDAYLEAGKMGIAMASTMNYSSDNPHEALDTLSRSTQTWTSKGASGAFVLDTDDDPGHYGDGKGIYKKT